MADETVINGEFSDAQSVEIAGDEDSPKIAALTQKISDLERENGKIIQQNESYRQKIDELKVSIEGLSNESADRKKELEELQSKDRMSGAVAARAAELEADVSRLQHDLISAMSDLEESNAEISNLKRDLEGVKEREKAKDVKLDAAVKERDLLLTKVGKMVEESESKEKEIQSLKESLEELKVVSESNKVLEKTVEQLSGKITVLKASLEEKEKAIAGFETKERAVEENMINGDALVDCEEKGSAGGLKGKNWLVVGGSAIAAVAVVGAACYVRSARER